VQSQPRTEISPPISQRSPRTPQILAKTIYRELRGNGLDEREVLSIANEMLRLVAGDIRDS
jgi:hypothetical protein